ncbi:MAG TPA: hypothetical protein VE008_07420 [Burkholderiales bacterium]|nr:hypothetical protein [Burkholderiales bacterium]
MDPQMQALYASLVPGPTAWYIIALFAGLYAQYQAARTNGRTGAASFKDYWFKETPGASVATGIALLFAAGATIKGGSLASMSSWEVLEFGFSKAFLFDAVIQFPSAKSDSPAAGKAAGFARPGMLVALLLALVGCALFANLEKPKGFQDDAAYMKGTLAGGVRSAAAALRSGAIKVEDDEKVQEYAIKVRDGVKLAESMYGQCIATIPATTVTPGQGGAPAVAVPASASAIQAAIDACGKGDAQSQLRLTQAILDGLTAYLLQRGVKTQ